MKLDDAAAQLGKWNPEDEPCQECGIFESDVRLVLAELARLRGGIERAITACIDGSCKNPGVSAETAFLVVGGGLRGLLGANPDA